MWKLTIGSAVIGATLALVVLPPAHATILLFDQDGPNNPTTNFANIPQQYGDNVTSASQGGFTYGDGGEGFTPNLTVEYGTPGEDPDLWTTGYGDLTNVHFNDADGDTTFTTTFTADAGFEVGLFDFDMASFSTNGQNIQGLDVRDPIANTSLFSLGSTFITGGSTHLGVTPNVWAPTIELAINLTGLGGVSDDIGIDNVRFGQRLISQPPSIPVPASIVLLGAGLIGLGAVAGGRRR